MSFEVIYLGTEQYSTAVNTSPVIPATQKLTA